MSGWRKGTEPKSIRSTRARPSRDAPLLPLTARLSRVPLFWLSKATKGHGCGDDWQRRWPDYCSEKKGRYFNKVHRVINRKI